MQKVYLMLLVVFFICNQSFGTAKAQSDSDSQVKALFNSQLEFSNQGEYKAISFAIVGLPEENIVAVLKSFPEIKDFTISENQSDIEVAVTAFKYANRNYLILLLEALQINMVSVAGADYALNEIEEEEFGPADEAEFLKGVYSKGSSEYYQKRVDDVRHKIRYVLKNKESLKTALQNNWFEQAEEALNRALNQQSDYESIKK